MRVKIFDRFWSGDFFFIHVYLITCRDHSIWTTEKEINIFSDLNISGDITQTIDNGNLQNYIPFQKGGGLEVSGTVTPDDDMQERTNFEFISAELDLDWFKFSFPPIGKGWFDTVYLDDDLRVDENR